MKIEDIKWERNMRFVFTCCGSGLLGAVTSIFGYGWLNNEGINPAGVFINLLGVIIIVALSCVLFEK